MKELCSLVPHFHAVALARKRHQHHWQPHTNFNQELLVFYSLPRSSFGSSFSTLMLRILTPLPRMRGLAIRSISCGIAHMLLLVAEDQNVVYAMGRNDSGQCGISIEEPKVLRPVQVATAHLPHSTGERGWERKKERPQHFVLIFHCLNEWAPEVTIKNPAPHRCTVSKGRASCPSSAEGTTVLRRHKMVGPIPHADGTNHPNSCQSLTANSPHRRWRLCVGRQHMRSAWHRATDAAATAAAPHQTVHPHPCSGRIWGIPGK